MNPTRLEDEFGDIVAKARKGLGHSRESLAQIVGLPPADIAEIESYRLVPDAPIAEKIAAALRLNAEKLIQIARGEWLPAEKSLQNWGNLAVIPSDYGGYEVNCYLQWDDEKNAALFDTGVAAREIFSLLEHENLRLSTVFITHSHGDHVGALDEILQKFRVPVRAVGTNVRDGQKFSVGALEIEARETPGHTADGATFVVRASQKPLVAHVGDAIFAGSVGGASFSYEKLLKTVREKILSLPDDTLLCPGHGPLTTVGEEKQHNPFF
jgi:hydroxyacylglutathione hydrolase